MSGIYIPGMEMPTKGHCKILIIHNDSEVCDFYTREKISNTIPVPDHGRLIDADALEYHADNVKDPMGRTEKTVMWKKIEAAPTIIPAEEVYAQGYDTVGNYHWIGTHSGEHIIPADKEDEDEI